MSAYSYYYFDSYGDAILEVDRYLKKLTPGEKVKTTKESVQKLAVKFKLPMNVADAIWNKLIPT